MDVISTDRFPSADPIAASKEIFDIAIIGCGALGAVLAYTLAQSGRKVVCFDSNLSEPDRIIGELLQPGGCLSLKKLGMDSCLEGIGAIPTEGYKIFWGGEEVEVEYPTETIKMAWSDGGIGKDGRVQQGRCFHYGKFIQSLRRKAATAPNLTIIEATVNELIQDVHTNAVLGVTATPRSTGASDASEPLSYHAAVTLIIDGCHSRFRKSILPKHVYPTVRSNFVGLILEDAVLPAPNHGHVILRKDPPANGERSPIGPVLAYQLSEHETRMLIDICGPRVPSSSKGELANFLSAHVTELLPPSIVPSFQTALDKSMGPDRSYRLRTMPNQYLPPYPQGRGPDGAILVGDSLNMRHPLTGGGMTVAFNDAVILTQRLGGGKQVGDIKWDDQSKVIDLDNWALVCEQLEDWHWERKNVATCINVLAMALYSLFGADDENLEVLKEGCFKYFELGGEAVSGPVSLLSALRPSPLLLVRHFFSVALYSIWVLFTFPRGKSHRRPSILQYPALGIKSLQVLYTACAVLLPVLWSEGQM